MNKQAIRSLLFLLGWSSVIFFTIAAVGQQTGRSLPALSTWIDEDNDARPDPAEPSATATQTLVPEWRDVCVFHRMEISGIGMGDQHTHLNPQTLSLSSSTSVNWLLAQVAGRLGDSSPIPDSVTFTTDTSVSITLNEPTRSSQYGYSFENEIGQATNQITASVDNIGGDFKTPRGLILYARQDMGNEPWTSIGKTTNDFVYWGSNSTHTEVFTFTALAEPVDFFITAAVIDNNDDERPLVLEARAGGKTTTSGPISKPNAGPLLNIIDLTLPQVPSGTDQISVTLKSPPGNGDSLVLVGLNVSYPCPEVGADLEITETVGLAAVNESELITYTVTVTNNGPSDATSVWVTDTLPTGLIFGGYTATQGIYTGATGLWEVGDLANKATATLMITATVNSCSGGPMIANTAVVTTATDPNPDNNEATVSVTSTVAMYCIYLPIVYKNFEPCRFYDFSFQEGDWINYEDGHTKFGYINGEFQMVAKNPLRTHLAWPGGKYENYTITATVRWVENSAKGEKYGLTFGIADDLSSFYTFMVYPHAQDYEIKYYNGSWNLIYFGHSSAINTGIATNHLWLERLNGTISITVNNTSLASINATQISAKRHVGIGVGPYTLYPGNSYAEARFDDYQICPMDAVSFTNLDLLTKEKEAGSRGRSVPGG